MRGRRQSMSRRGSRRHFAKHAVKVHKRNVPPPMKMPMRGGIRL